MGSPGNQGLKVVALVLEDFRRARRFSAKPWACFQHSRVRVRSGQCHRDAEILR